MEELFVTYNNKRKAENNNNAIENFWETLLILFPGDLCIINDAPEEAEEEIKDEVGGVEEKFVKKAQNALLLGFSAFLSYFIIYSLW